VRFGSLFAGIGGFDLGFERAGMECAWQVENHPYCNAVLAKHWPDVPRFGDIHDFPGTMLVYGAEVFQVDLICGGFPCQPASHAGPQKGMDDERWLWPEMRRVCEALHPRWVVAENPRGLLSADAGRLMGTVCRDLADLGYLVEWDCIPAAFVGADHLRERIFIVGYSDNPGSQGLSGHVVQVHEPGWFGARSNGSLAKAGLFGAAGRGTPASWLPEPDVGRVAPRIPNRLDRTESIGNAVCPQVAEYIGRLIMKKEKTHGHHEAAAHAGADSGG